jgi:SAM-dependent methyltransferase
MSRPELTGHASLFYNAKEAKKYDSSSRMIGVQREITERAIELLRLPADKPSFILDIGCGSGLSGQVLEETGHVWVGCDVSRDMLDVANERVARKREAATDRMNDDDNDDDDDDDEEEDTSPSTGDLMHHVSVFRTMLALVLVGGHERNSTNHPLSTGHGDWIAFPSSYF